MEKKQADSTELTDGDVLDYLYCPAKYYVTKLYSSQLSLADGSVSDIVKRATRNTLQLPGRIIREALSIYESKKYPLTFFETVHGVWHSWLKVQHDAPEDILQAIFTYGDTRNNQVLAPYFNGDIVKRDRKKYIEPRMASRYKTSMRHFEPLVKSVDENMLDRMMYTSADLENIGTYSISEAYADSMIMAKRFPAPEPDTILAANKYVSITLESGRNFLYLVDMLYKEKTGKVVLEVHDAHPGFFYLKSWVGRKLRVILGSYALANYDPEGILVFRHMLSGDNQVLRDLRSARAVLGVEYALNGIQQDIFTPAFLGDDLSRCRGCSAYALCHLSGDLLEWLMPGLEKTGERIEMAANHLKDRDLDDDTLNAIREVVEVYQVLPTSIIRALSQSKKGKPKGAAF